ncbi:MAG: tetratricopeptide repeat protein [Thermodesulfobacteriota bacterium]
MGTIKIGKLINAVVCLVIFISVVNCYGAKGKAEEFYEQGKKDSAVKNADSAIFNYSKAIKINPKFAKAYNNRGVAYIWKRQYYLAIADFDKAIKLDPKDGKAYNNRAIVYSYLGEINKARQDLLKAKSLGIEVNPDFLKYLETLPSIPEPIFHKPAPHPSKAPQQK